MSNTQYFLSAIALVLYFGNASSVALGALMPSGRDFENTAQNRANELKQLQQNNPLPAHSAQTKFPTSIADIPMETRLNNAYQGYLPFKDAAVYQPIKIQEPEDVYSAKLEIQRRKDEQTMTPAQYCTHYPLAEKCHPTVATQEQFMTVNYDNTPPAQQHINPIQQGPQGLAGPQNFSVDEKINSGKCTPPDLWTEQGFSVSETLKYTTKRYFRTDQPFAKSMLAVMQSEGMTCVQELSDSSTVTCYGYMQKTNPDIDVRTLTLSSAEDRTHQKFYKDTGIDKLPDFIKGDVMHVAFWRGPAKAIPTLCRILNVQCSDRQGTVTTAIVDAAKKFNGDLHLKYWQETYTELRNRNSAHPEWLPAFHKRVQNGINNGCHVTPRNPVNIQ